MKARRRGGRVLIGPATIRGLRAELLEDRRLLALTTTDLNAGLTATDLAQALVGPGITISNVTFTGDNSAGGQFSGGVSEGLGIDSGVMLSSGSVANAASPNNSDNITGSFDLPGDADLDSLVPGFTTEDATILEFDFVATAGTLSFQYVFASEEYNEFVNLNFNDVFGFFLNGENIALIPGTTTPVAIDNVNNLVNSQFYNDNDFSDFLGVTPFPTQADGFTVVLQAAAIVPAGTNHIKLAIADVGDTNFDSWVFLAGQSFVSGEVDLEITTIDAPDPVPSGDQLTYTVQVANLGPDTATNVLIQDNLPSGVTFVNAIASSGSVFQLGSVITAVPGAIAPGEVATLTITVIPTLLGPITNRATAQAAQVDNFQDNNTSIEDTIVTRFISISDVVITEGNTGATQAEFTVSIFGSHDTVVTVSYYTIDISATAGSDYQPKAGALSFPVGVSTQTIVVPIINDLFHESTELFGVQLLNPVNINIEKGFGVGTILDDDLIPALYVNDVHVTTTEAGVLTAVFTVALDRPSGQNVSVNYTTVDDTAIAGVDYVGVSGGLVFAPGITTLSVTVPILTSEQYSANKTFLLNLLAPENAIFGDPQGIGRIIFAPPPVNEFIIDNGDPLYSRSGGWTNLTNTLAYNLDYDYHAAGNGSGQATWNFDDIPQGTYQVLTKWIPFSNRATNAPYTILDDSTPIATVLVNQQLFPTGDQSNGITWQSLGMFSTSTGVLRVRLGDNANGFVIADAVRLVRDGIATQVPEMDVAAFGHSINTGDVTPALEDGTDFGIVASQSNSVTHTFNIVNNGNAPLHLTDTSRVEVFGANAGDFTVITQPNAVIDPGNGTTFQVLFHPTDEGLRQAVISIANDDDTEHPYTFHVQGTGAEAGPSLFIIDDQGAGFTKSQNWATNQNSFGYGNFVSTVAGGNGSEWARWTFGGLAPGEYDVYATWVAFVNRATNAPFTLADGDVSRQLVRINQQQGPATPINSTNWAAIGSVDVTTGELDVSLTNAANGYVVADAVMIVRRGAPAITLMAHNASMPFDVNGDRRVTPTDALLVVNQLLTASAETQATPLTSSLTAGAGCYRDVNGDGKVSPRDALMVISHLLTQPNIAPKVSLAAPIAEPAAVIAEPAAAIAQPVAGPARLAAIDAALSLMEPSADDPAPFAAIGTLPIEPPARGLVATASESACRRALEFATAGAGEGEQENEVESRDEA